MMNARLQMSQGVKGIIKQAGKGLGDECKAKRSFLTVRKTAIIMLSCPAYLPPSLNGTYSSTHVYPKVGNLRGARSYFVSSLIRSMCLWQE